ncbi:HNH endonuclease [uncultured Candidatus Puniceispirillum sp.]|jgi:hypothetical protein|uniref:HNH endonuclease n=1 Tax=uncultured Candidatus Puniceispirillum sp. TaxID=1985115 RepID=UPI0032B2ACFF
MARENDLEWMPQVLEAAELWREKCFYGDGALFSDDQNEKLWTLENIQELYDCLKKLQKQKGDYWSKLAIQMKDEAPKIIRLQAEVKWMLRLFPIGKSMESNRHTKILVSTKRSNIKNIMSWGGMSLPNTPLLSEQVLLGVGKPGTSYLKNLPYMQLFFLNLVCDWKTLPDQEQQKFKQNGENTAWQFAEYCDQFLKSDLYKPSEALPFRHALLFFLYPDYFERMVSEGHKDECPNHFKILLSDTTTRHPSTPLETDKALYEIRQKLELIYPNDIVDFYLEPIQKDGHWIDANDAFEEYKKAGQAPISPNTNRQSAHHQPAPATTGDTSSDVKSDIDALRPEELKEKGHTKQTEGERKLVKHYVRERAPKLRKAKLGAMIKKYDHLKCECCDTIGDTYKPEVRRSVFEVHHKKPLSEGMTINGLDDLALLCANCHRAIHATNPLLSVEEFKNSIT